MQKTINLAYRVAGAENKYRHIVCNKTIIPKAWTQTLIASQPIQKPHACLFCVALQVDVLSSNPNSFFESLSIKGAIQDPTKLHLIYQEHGDRVGDFFAERLHLKPIYSGGLVNKSPKMSEDEFIQSCVSHEVFSTMYISAMDIQEHFENKGTPLYSMIRWNLSDAEKGYELHAILIVGVDTNNKVHFWDVSDKLDTAKHGRLRQMDINDFNDRRNLSLREGGEIITRTPVYTRPGKEIQ
jgi:hypothetical protein